MGCFLIAICLNDVVKRQADDSRPYPQGLLISAPRTHTLENIGMYLRLHLCIWQALIQRDLHLSCTLGIEPTTSYNALPYIYIYESNSCAIDGFKQQHKQTLLRMGTFGTLANNIVPVDYF